jgi:hypothetical protein
MKRQRHAVTFTDSADIEVIVLGQLGRSTAYIQLATGLSPCQITYRLTKAKAGEGLPLGEGYRTQWRNGTSATAKQVERIMRAKLRRRNRRVLPPKFVVVSAWSA